MSDKTRELIAELKEWASCAMSPGQQRRLMRSAAEALEALLPGDNDQERKSRRWYAACWRDNNGSLNPLESASVVREYAEADVVRWREQMRREPSVQPDRVVLATKFEYPWVPVEEVPA